MINLINSEFDWILKKLDKNIIKFNNKFPSSCTKDGKYEITENNDWTEGFYIGMYVIAYEYSKQKKYLDYARRMTNKMIKRIDDKVNIDHHDIGFLVIYSIIALYKLTNEEIFKTYALKSADILMSRFHVDSKFIQAWSTMDDSSQYRLIVDSIININILNFAYKQTKEIKYKKVYEEHYNNIINNIIRDDYSSFHTFYFDEITKKPKFGKTFQGFSDDSCWARGQAWLLLGISLDQQIEFKEKNHVMYNQCLNYVLKYLKDDPICYWDFSLHGQKTQPKDSSSSIIIAISMLINNCNLDLVDKIIVEISNNYSAKTIENHDCLVEKNVYSYFQNKGVNEGCLWADYFYMELLLRRLTNNTFKSFYEE